MQGKKAIFLGLALLLPVGIFIFLKMFGKNEFDVPALYQQEAPPPSANCVMEYKSPYIIPDSIMLKVRAAGQADFFLVVFSSDDLSSRIKQEINPAEITFVKASDLVAEVNIPTVKECAFILRSNADLALIDKDGKMRGVYTSTNRDDVDRLILETEILLKKY